MKANIEHTLIKTSLFKCSFFDAEKRVVGTSAAMNETQLMDEVITGSFRHQAVSVALTHHHPQPAETAPRNQNNDCIVVSSDELQLCSTMKYLLRTIGVNLTEYTIIANDQKVMLSDPYVMI